LTNTGKALTNTCVRSILDDMIPLRKTSEILPELHDESTAFDGTSGTLGYGAQSAGIKASVILETQTADSGYTTKSVARNQYTSLQPVAGFLLHF
jgi:hypothetical protein